MGAVCTVEQMECPALEDTGLFGGLHSKDGFDGVSRAVVMARLVDQVPSLHNYWCVEENEGLTREELASVSRRLPNMKFGPRAVVERGCEEALLDLLRSAGPSAALAARLPMVGKQRPESRLPEGRVPLSVAVIGGGIAGLLTAKWMKEEGLRVVIFEGSQRLGGTWAEGSSRLYPTLHSNTPRSWMHFSDFEFPAPDVGPSDFPHHSVITTQIAAYIKHFGLARFAELNSRVDRVSRSKDGWVVEVNGVERRFDCVCLCNGKLQEPSVPDADMPGLDKASLEDVVHVGSHACVECQGPPQQQGTLFFHSSRLGSIGHNVFSGRHVVVVGFGQASGADICELAAAKGAASVTVVVEKPIFLLPRLLDGRPVEESISVLGILQPQLMPLLAQLPGLQKFPANAPEDFQFGVHTPTRVWTLHEMIAQGRVVVVQDKVACYQDGYVLLTHGGVLPADVVVFCTGYKSRALDVLEPRVREKVLKDAPLYEGVWAPDAPGLAAIGHDESIWYFIEMQARWAARVWSGSAPPPPPPEAMRAQIAKARAEMQLLRPRLRRQPSPLTVPGEALEKLVRMAMLADVWPSSPQLAMRLFSTFEPRLVHGICSF